MPLIVPCTVHTSKKDLYDAVWIQVSRLASPLPPQEASNHAQDWSVASAAHSDHVDDQFGCLSNQSKVWGHQDFFHVFQKEVSNAHQGPCVHL